MSKQKKGLVPELRFPEFRNNESWTALTLSELSNRITEKVGTKKLTTVSITAGVGFVSQAEKFNRDISGKQYKNYIHLRKGEYSYNKGNSKAFPQGCIYKLQEFNEVAAPNAFISFRFKKNYVGDFFRGYFESNYHGRQLMRFITSGARSDGLLNISSDDFFSIIFPTPLNILEQQKIADCLASIDELITLHTHKLNTLKDHKKGLMQKIFPTEGETTPKLRFPEFRNGEKWKELSLGIFIEEYKENSKTLNEHEVLTSARSGLIRQRDYYDNHRITERDNTGFNIIPPGYVTYRSRSDDQRFFFNENNLGIIGIISTYYPVFRFINGCNKFFIELLSYYWLKVGMHSVGTSQTVLSIKQLKKLHLPIPKKPEQEKIASMLIYIDESIAAHEDKIQQLKAHKNGLIQKLFPVTDEVM